MYDWGSLLQDLGSLLPRDCTLWMVNRFGDLFIIPNDGSVQMVDVGGGTIERITSVDEAEVSKQYAESAHGNLSDADLRTTRYSFKGKCSTL